METYSAVAQSGATIARCKATDERDAVVKITSQLYNYQDLFALWKRNDCRLVKDHSQEDFDRVLEEVVKEKYTSVEILHFPGVYEIVSGELNNEVIDKLNMQQEE